MQDRPFTPQHEETDLMLDSSKLEAEFTSRRQALPATLTFTTKRYISWSSKLKAYILLRRSAGLWNKHIANELNDFYNTDLFTEKALIGIVDRERKKQKRVGGDM